MIKDVKRDNIISGIVTFQNNLARNARPKWVTHTS